MPCPTRLRALLHWPFAPLRHSAGCGRLVGSLIAVASGCSGDLTSVVRPAPPVIVSARVAANPYNVLSAILDAGVRGADSVAVHVSGPSNLVTPALAGTDSVRIPVLGLLPATAYAMSVVAFGPGGTTVSTPLPFTTGSLPWDLPAYEAAGSDPSPGFVVFSAGGYGLVIDNSGRIVWYRQFPEGAGLAFMAQPNGRYVTRPRHPDPTGALPWIEIDVLGNVTRKLTCAHGFVPRLHDLIAGPDGDYWILCDEPRTVDLTAAGGLANAVVTGTAVQHVSAAGALLFEWSPFEHFDVHDMDATDLRTPAVNWTHGNAIDIAPDGNVIVSFRNLSEITKIDVYTGAVLWRLGGVRNEFSFLDATDPPFYRQHSARMYAPGALLLLDNMGDSAASRAERYVLDEPGRTVRLTDSYGPTPAAVTAIGGSVQSLPGGRVLVSIGTAGRVEEYDAAGHVLWGLTGEAGYVFRAQRIMSLYTPGVGTPR